MRTYTKVELENKVSQFNDELNNPHLTKSEKQRIQNAISYYIQKLSELDTNPSLKSISA